MATHKPPGSEADFVTVLLPPRLVKALDRYISEEVPTRNRSEALRNAFQEWCVDRG
jgi:metal-responsive CopG/Arc/MetJ family transcriptional regulator